MSHPCMNYLVIFRYDQLRSRGAEETKEDYLYSIYKHILVICMFREYDSIMRVEQVFTQHSGVY